MMFQNHIKTAYRNSIKNKLYTFILVGGLAIGIATSLLILEYINIERSFDSFHTKADRIYRLNLGNLNREGQSAVSSGAMTPAFAPDFPEIENFVRFRKFPSLVAFGDKRFNEDKFFYTDSTVFEVFDFELLEGRIREVLAEPFSIVLTEHAAKKYFGEKEAVGQVLEIDNQFSFQVKGIMKNVPETAHFSFDFLASISSLRQHPDESVRYWQLNSWYSHYYHSYLLLKENADAEALAQKIEHIAKDYSNPEFYAQYGREMGLYLQALRSIHLHSAYGELEAQGRIQNIYIFGIVVFFILLIACSNYANLAVALALKRNKEIAVHKVMGAKKLQLATKFFAESFLISGLGLLGGLVLAQVFSAALSNLLGYSIQLTWALVPIALLLFLFTGILGGIYPAFIGTSFQSASIFRNTGQKLAGLSLSKGLVVFQFTISMLFIVATLVVYQQMKFMQEQPLGMDIEQVVVLPTRGDPEVSREFAAFETELKKEPAVANTTISELVPGQQIFGFVVKFEGMEDGENFPTNPVGYDFFQTYDMELLAGRSFSREMDADSLEKAVINETLARQLGWIDPQEAIGKRYDFANDGENVGEVIGVVKDAHFRSLQFTISPLLFLIDNQFDRHISIRLATNNLAQSLASIENTWASFFPELPFEYFFADEYFGRQYEADQKMTRLFFYFVGLTILLACMGLFGLAALAANRRTKEIGIRKVLGASVLGIVGLLSKDFIKLVLLALVLAVPLSWYVINLWLEDFAYRIAINWWVFLIAAVVVMGVAILTVSWQSLRAAVANPIESLRNE